MYPLLQFSLRQRKLSKQNPHKPTTTFLTLDPIPPPIKNPLHNSPTPLPHNLRLRRWRRRHKPPLPSASALGRKCSYTAALTSFIFEVAAEYVNAIYHSRPDWALPWIYLLILPVFLALSLLLAALWAGAITPVFSTKRSTEQMALPSFMDVSRLNDQIIESFTYTTRTSQGTFTYVPQFDLQGLILDAVQYASCQNGAPNSHTKLDKTGYKYLGRSYGVGSSLRLMDEFARSAQHVTSITYNEVDHVAEPSSFYNMTSDLHLEPLQIDDGWSIVVFNARSKLPNGFSPIFVAAGLRQGGVLAMGAGTNRNDLFPSQFVVLAASKLPTVRTESWIMCNVRLSTDQ